MFKVGDKVRAFGCDGVVVDVDEKYPHPCPVVVDFGNNWPCNFTLDGKYATWHKEPSLVLVERAEKFEEVVGYVAVYEYTALASHAIYTGATIYKTKEEAMKLKKAIGYQEIKYFRKVE